MARKKLRVAIARFWTGATVDEIAALILPDLRPYFDFEASDRPQLLLYGPYAGPVPRGDAVKVFIGCENLLPIMEDCDWAFGVVHEDHFPHPRYMRLARWGDDSGLIQKDKDWSAVLGAKRRFCAFLYASEMPYREAFCRALRRYKPVDAPGRSMNNMPSIDPVPGTVDWSAKIAFLSTYKFVIAFENGSRAGYNTEKLTHAIEADCVPIYWGDPEIGRSFNTRRFIDGRRYLPAPFPHLPRLYRGHALASADPPRFLDRARRRFDREARLLEQRVWSLRGFDRLIERLIEVDRDDALYLQHLREPFFVGNKQPDRTRWVARWSEILDAAAAR